MRVSINIAILACLFVLSCGSPVKEDKQQIAFHPKHLVRYPQPLSSSNWSKCAFDENGIVGCWNNKRFGGQVIIQEFPEVFALEGSAFSQCGLEGNKEYAQGELWCYGFSVGFKPARMIQGLLFAGLDISPSHVCAFTKSGDAYCGGLNDFGQLGDGTQETSYNNETHSWLPVKVQGVREPVTDLVVGSSFSCALMKSGRVSCWGRNQDGELGIGSLLGTGIMEDTTSPALLPITGTVNKIEAGASFACAWVDEQTGRNSVCWGRLDSFYSDLPVNFPSFASATSVSIDYNFACAVLDKGNVYCVGNNDARQLGPNKRNSWPVPLPLKAIDVTTFGDHACAILEDSRIACWGGGERGITYTRLFFYE